MIKKKKLKINCSIFFIFSTLFILNSIYLPERTLNELKNEKIVFHAMGTIDGKNYSNSLEAFIKNYQKGIRVFEVDLVLTKDNFVVLRHYWNKDDMSKGNFSDKLTLEEFKNTKILGEYTALSFEDLLNLMEEYKDIYFILDIKETEKENFKLCFQSMKNSLNNRDYETIKRLIPQVVSIDMYNELKKEITFPLICYGLYLGNFDENSIIEFIKKENIKIVSMWDYDFNDEFARKLKGEDVFIYVHTINDKIKALNLLNNGADGIYTDELYKNILK